MSISKSIIKSLVANIAIYVPINKVIILFYIKLYNYLTIVIIFNFIKVSHNLGQSFYNSIYKITPPKNTIYTFIYFSFKKKKKSKTKKVLDYININIKLDVFLTPNLFKKIVLIKKKIETINLNFKI